METSETNLLLSKENLHDINETRKWTYFLAVVGFIGVGFLVVAGLFVGSLFESSGQEMPFPHGAATGFYLVVAIIYFFPILYLFRFSVKAKKAVYEQSSHELTSALLNLKRHYKFMGVIAIVMLSINVLALLFMILGAAFI